MDILGKILFRYRGILPIPWLVAIFILLEPTPISLWCGLLLTLCGEVMRICALTTIGKYARTTKYSVGPLCNTGLYSWSRNPLYIANILIWIGVFLMPFYS